MRKPSTSFFERIKLRLEVKVKKGTQKVVLKKTSIRQCERAIQFSFPKSYHEFLLLIGPGTFRGYFFIDGPKVPGSNNKGIVSRTKMTRGNSVLADVYEDPEVVGRMIPFGDTVAGDILFWDPTDITNRKQDEHGIFVLPRDSYSVIRLSSTFLGFFRDVCFGHGFEDLVIGTRDPEWKLDYEFIPVCSKTKAS